MIVGVGLSLALMIVLRIEVDGAKTRDTNEKIERAIYRVLRNYERSDLERAEIVDRILSHQIVIRKEILESRRLWQASTQPAQ